MKFSSYILKFLNEGEILDQNKIITELITDLPLNLKELILTNISKFAYKPTDYKKNSRILNYNKTDLDTYTKIFNELNANGITYKVGKDYFLLDDYNLKIRKTGAKIENYWKEGSDKSMSSAEATVYNEISVLIWLLLLSSGRKDIEEFTDADYKKIKCGDSGEKVKKTLEYLKSEREKGTKSWYFQTQKTAQGLLKYPKMPKNLNNYTFHRGSKLFDLIKKGGAKLSGLPGAADKWNPSDVILIKNGFKISNYRTLEELNAILGEFNDIIGISLKGASAGHGAISLENLYKFIGLIPKRAKPVSMTNKKLDSQGIDYITGLLKSVKKTANVCPFLGGVVLYIGANHKYAIKENGKLKKIKDLLLQMKPNSDNWGESMPPTLGGLAGLNSSELWERFTFLGYSIASSQTDWSAPHLKADGNGYVKVVNEKHLDPRDFVCYCCRIPLSGETNVIFDASYKGVSLKLQFRSKGGAPQMTIWETREVLTDANKYSQIKEFKDI